MIQIVLLLIGLTIGTTYPIGIEPDFFDPRLTAAGVPSLCLLYAAIGFAISRTYVRRFLQARDEPLELFASYQRCMTLYRALLLGVYALQVYTLMWPSFVSFDLRLARTILVEKLLVLLPLPVSLFLSWIPLYRLNRLLSGSDWSLRAYLVFQSRLALGPVIGLISILYLIDDAVHAHPAMEVLFARFQALELLLILVVLVVLSLLAPVLLRLVWGGTPVPEGPLRDRLNVLCGRAGLDVRDLLVWETFGGRFANALVTGVLPRLRYVFFTRPLLDRLREEELDAVLAHELGHARHRHLVWYLVFAVGLMLLVFGLSQVIGDGAGEAIALGFGPVAGFWSFIMLYASKRFETQADLHSLRVVGSAAPLASALLKVSALNGAPPGARSVTHGSIDDRVRFLQRAQEDPAMVVRFERDVEKVQRLIRGVFVAGVVVAAVTIAASWPSEPIDGKYARAETLLRQSVELEELGRYDEAIALAREVRSILPRDPRAWIQIGNCEERKGDFASSREAFEEALRLYVGYQRPDPRYRVALLTQIQDLDLKLREEGELQRNSK